jgi:hypothetical protein
MHKILVKSFFKILNFSASPTLCAKPTRYPGFLVVSGSLETRSKNRTGQSSKTSEYGKFLVSPLLEPVLLFSKQFDGLHLYYGHMLTKLFPRII